MLLASVLAQLRWPSSIWAATPVVHSLRSALGVLRQRATSTGSAPRDWPGLVMRFALTGVLVSLGWLVCALLWTLSAFLVVLALGGGVWWCWRKLWAGPAHAYGSARWATARDLRRHHLLDQPHGMFLGRWELPLTPGADLLEAIWAFLRTPWQDRWASRNACYRLLQALFLGYVLAWRNLAKGPILRTKDAVTLVTSAPSGAGKGVGAVIPTLLDCPTSMVVTDPKGENLAKTGRFRRDVLGHAIVVIAPFGGGEGWLQATLNPLQFLDPDDPRTVDDVRALANAKVVRSIGDEKDPHWNDCAETGIVGGMLYVLENFAAPERNLDSVAELLSSSAGIDLVITGLQNSDGFGGAARRVGNTMAQWAGDERSSILSSLYRHLSFLDSPLSAASLQSGDFDPLSLFAKPTTLYLILPTGLLKSHSRLLRVWTTTLVRRLMQHGEQEQQLVRFLLDEVGQWGKGLPVVRDLATILRSYGCRSQFLFQALSQVEEVMEKAEAETLLANSEQQYFGFRHVEQATPVSKACGDTTIQPVGRTWPNFLMELVRGLLSGNLRGVFARGPGYNITPTARNLIKPEEVLQLDADAQILLLKGCPPIKARLAKYYDDPHFQPNRSDPWEEFAVWWSAAITVLLFAVCAWLVW